MIVSTWTKLPWADACLRSIPALVKHGHVAEHEVAQMVYGLGTWVNTVEAA